MPYFTGEHEYGQPLIDAICAAIESTGKWGTNIASDPPSNENRWRRVYKSVAEVNGRPLVFDIATSTEPGGSGIEPEENIDVLARGTYHVSGSTNKIYWNNGVVIGSAYDYMPGIPSDMGGYSNLCRNLLLLLATSKVYNVNDPDFTNPYNTSIEWHIVVEDTFIYLAVMDANNKNARSCGFFGKIDPWADHPDGAGVMITSTTRNANNQFTSVDGPYARSKNDVFHAVSSYGGDNVYNRLSYDRSLYLHPILIYAQPQIIQDALLIGSMQDVFVSKLKQADIWGTGAGSRFVKSVSGDGQSWMLFWPYVSYPAQIRLGGSTTYPYNGFQYGYKATNVANAEDFVLAVKYTE